MRKAHLVALFAVALAACGDNWHRGGDDAGTIDSMPVDAAPPDAVNCPAPAAGQVGGPCTQSTDCDKTTGSGDGVCYVGAQGPSTFPPEGYCTLDDGSGAYCATDNDCGAGNVCATDESGYKFCIAGCVCASNACPPHQACLNSFNGDPLDKNGCVPGNAGAHDGDACNGFYDCDDYSTCLNDSLDYPGGQCSRYACTVGTDSTCHGGHCINATDPPFQGTLCVDVCTGDSDCRQAEGYKCFDGGGAVGKYCRHPQVGDTCASAADCGGAGWTCETGATFPNGYCTATGCPTPGSSQGCSTGSVCYDDPLLTDNYCVDRCTTIGSTTECRTGYQCLDTDPAPGTTTPACVPL